MGEKKEQSLEEFLNSALNISEGKEKSTKNRDEIKKIAETKNTIGGEALIRLCVDGKKCPLEGCISICVRS